MSRSQTWVTSRGELKKREAAILRRQLALEADRARLVADRQALAAEKQALAAERARLDVEKEKCRALLAELRRRINSLVPRENIDRMMRQMPVPADRDS